MNKRQRKKAARRLADALACLQRPVRRWEDEAVSPRPWVDTLPTVRDADLPALYCLADTGGTMSHVLHLPLCAQPCSVVTPVLD